MDRTLAPNPVVHPLSIQDLRLTRNSQLRPG
jgi:hypothetical protein